MQNKTGTLPGLYVNEMLISTYGSVFLGKKENWDCLEDVEAADF